MSRLSTKLRRGLRPLYIAALDLATDAWLGARTRGVVHNEAFLRRFSPGRDGNHYEPIRPDKFWRMMIAAGALRPGDRATFVDLGAGRGRAMLLAAELGFADIVGVELDEGLAAEARANVTRYRGRRRLRPRTAARFRIQRCDAAEADLPDGPRLVFIYNSFGAATLRRVLRRLAEAADPVVIAYFNPEHDAVFSEVQGLVRSKAGKDWVIWRTGPGTAAAR